MIEGTDSRINGLDTSMMVILIPVIRQYIRTLYKRTGLVAVHCALLGSRSCDYTFHAAALMTLEFNVEKKTPSLPRIEHVPLIFV